MRELNEAARRYHTENRQALELWVNKLQNALDGSEDASQLELQLQGSDLPRLPLGPRVMELLSEALSEILVDEQPRIERESNGNRLMTTQEAATFLQVSRPFVVKLMESGQLPFQRIGTHRRVRLTDLLRYQEESFVAAQSALDELVEEGQAMELGYRA